MEARQGRRGEEDDYGSHPFASYYGFAHMNFSRRAEEAVGNSPDTFLPPAGCAQVSLAQEDLEELQSQISKLQAQIALNKGEQQQRFGSAPSADALALFIPAVMNTLLPLPWEMTTTHPPPFALYPNAQPSFPMPSAATLRQKLRRQRPCS